MISLLYSLENFKGETSGGGGGGGRGGGGNLRAPPSYKCSVQGRVYRITNYKASLSILIFGQNGSKI